MNKVTKTIRVDDETYERICRRAGELQMERKRRVPLDEAIRTLLKLTPTNNRISDLAGTWQVEDKEVRTILAALREGWKQWQLPTSA
jgi:hypothetical protein